ncbi:MAG: PBECR2 nuclease fold domain-containing protein [Candidatus Cloacimonadales bacterium]
MAGRFKYMNTNDEVLTNPDEAWLGKDKTRISYLKNCSKNIMLLVEVKDGYYEYFNIIIKRGTSSVNKKKNRFLTKIEWA